MRVLIGSVVCLAGIMAVACPVSAETLRIHAGRMVDVDKGRVLEDQAIRIENGRIVKVDENYVTVEIAAGTEVIVQKPSIGLVLPKGTMKALFAHAGLEQAVEAKGTLEAERHQGEDDDAEQAGIDDALGGVRRQ